MYMWLSNHDYSFKSSPKREAKPPWCGISHSARPRSLSSVTLHWKSRGEDPLLALLQLNNCNQVRSVLKGEQLQTPGNGQTRGVTAKPNVMESFKSTTWTIAFYYWQSEHHCCISLTASVAQLQLQIVYWMIWKLIGHQQKTKVYISWPCMLMIGVHVCLWVYLISGMWNSLQQVFRDTGVVPIIQTLCGLVCDCHYATIYGFLTMTQSVHQLSKSWKRWWQDMSVHAFLVYLLTSCKLALKA